MRATWQLAVNSLAGRRGRTALLVAATALATMLSVVVTCAVNTLQHSYAESMAHIAGASDVRVRHRAMQLFDESILAKVRNWPEVEFTAGRIEKKGVSVLKSNDDAGRDNEGKDDQVGRVDAIGIDPVLDPRFFPVAIVSGEDVQQAGQAVVDQQISKQLKLQVGDVIEFEWTDVKLTIVGIAEQPPLSVIQLPAVRMTVADAQRIAGYENRLRTLQIKLTEQAQEDPDGFVEAHKAELPSDLVFEASASLRAGINRAVKWTNLMSSIMMVLVGLSTVFIIVTGLTTAVTERTRELAILRCIGTGRLLIGGSQVIAGISIALLGVIIGTPLGIGFAWLLYDHFRDVLTAGFIVESRSMILAVGAVIAAGLIGALYPAWTAARVQPLQALATRAVKPKPALVWLCLVGGLIGALYEPVILWLVTSLETAFWLYLPVGVGLTFIGYCLLCVPLTVWCAKPLAAVISRCLKLPQTLLQQTILATPFRHGLTAGSLMIGLALMLSIWTEGGNLLYGWFDAIKMPDAYVHTGDRFPSEALKIIEDDDRVSAFCPIKAQPVRTRNVKFGIKEITPPFTLFASSDVEAFLNMTQVEWIQGDPKVAIPRIRQGNAVLVGREYLTAHGVGVGGMVTLAGANGDVTFEVVGVVGATGLDVAVQHFGIGQTYAEASVSTVFGTREDGIRYFSMDEPDLVLMDFKENVDAKTTLDEITSKMNPIMRGDIRADTSTAIRDFVHQIAVQLMAVASTLGLASLFIAAFGVANLIIAELNARRFEFGVLRAIGSQRAMLGRLIAGQTLAIALVACIAGTALGLQLGVVAKIFHARLVGIDYAWQMPWGVMALGATIVIAMAVGAAVPAIVQLMRKKPTELLAADA